MKRLLALTIATISAATNLCAGEFHLQEAIDNASSGEIVVIPPGTYTEPVIIRKKIILEGHDVVLKIKANQPAIQIETSRPVSLKNLEIQCEAATARQNGDRPYAVYTSGGDLLIENCIFKALGNSTESPCGVLAADKSKLEIRECRFDGFNYSIEIDSGTEAVIEDNLILRSGHCSIMINGSTGTLSRNIISESSAHGIRCTAGKVEADSNLIIGSGSCGFYIGNRSSIGMLSNNLILYNGVGMNVFARSELDIVNNVIHHSTRTGLAISDTAKLTIANNIISNNEKGIVGFSAEKSEKPSIKLRGENLVHGNTAQSEGIKLPSTMIGLDPQFENADAGLFALGTSKAKGMGLTSPTDIQMLWKKWKAATSR